MDLGEKTWEVIQTDSKAALNRIQDRFINLYQNESDREGWGQYLDPPPHRNHTGIYGTGSGIQVLSCNDDPDLSDLLQTSQEWIIEQWDSDDSKTANKGHRFLTYKAAFCLFGLTEKDTAHVGGCTEYNEEYADIVDNFYLELWERRVDKRGWGEYWLETEPDEPQLQSSALMILALLGHEDIRNKKEFKSILKYIGKRAYQEGSALDRQKIGNKTDTAVTVSLCLLALSRYRTVMGYQNIDKEIGNLIDDLGHVVGSIARGATDIDPSTYSTYLISLPESDELPPEDVWLEHYFIIILFPIIALALLEAGTPHVGHNQLFIRNVVQKYSDMILSSNADCFSSAKTNRCSTHDHFWIAMMLRRFSQTDISQESLLSKARSYLRSKYVGSVLLISVLLVMAIIAAMLNEIYQSSTITAISSLVIALIGALLGESEPVIWLKEHINNYFNAHI
ncbi:prenyltransferase/squalene oxidase repeat-containing protein [Natronococcus wangiae]|uniref:hypothetical protein n=1 Tax=Natronococcus wangiae TaxID=3068275 RepID=UPI00273FCDF1|nr:hypothetical protein [Natronococcus sp. AD5]